MNWFCTCIGVSSGIEEDKHGNMGSGFVFSPWFDVPLKVFDAWDMCLIEVEVGGRDERG